MWEIVQSCVLKRSGFVLQAEAAKNPASSAATNGAALKEITAAFTANVWEVHCKPGAQVTLPFIIYTSSHAILPFHPTTNTLGATSMTYSKRSARLIRPILEFRLLVVSHKGAEGRHAAGAGGHEEGVPCHGRSQREGGGGACGGQHPDEAG